MGLIQTAFEFGPPTPAAWLDPQLERLRNERLLEQRLTQLLGTCVALSVTDNARTMLSARRREGIAHVRVHHMFVGADETTVAAVARYLSDGHSVASVHLQRFIKENRRLIRPRQPRSTVHCGETRAGGARCGYHHDLHAICARLNARYFEPAVKARIAWARGGQRQRKRRSIKLGSYRGRERLIRVHPVLDAAWVPTFFVEYIVYHEMLHQVVAMPLKNGRRSLHGPEFRARERKFERFAEAIAWEHEHLDRLLSG